MISLVIRQARLASFLRYTQYARLIGGVDVRVVFQRSTLVKPRTASLMTSLLSFTYATQEIGDLSDNLTYPTKEYVVMLVPEINGVYPMNESDGAHGYFRGDFFSEASRPFGTQLTTEAFIGNGGAMRMEQFHEGLIMLLGNNGWVATSGRWTEAEKHESLVTAYNAYSGIAGTAEDDPVRSSGDLA